MKTEKEKYKTFEERKSGFEKECNLLKISVSSYMNEENKCCIASLTKLVGNLNRLCKADLRYTNKVLEDKDKDSIKLNSDVKKIETLSFIEAIVTL